MIVKKYFASCFVAKKLGYKKSKTKILFNTTRKTNIYDKSLLLFMENLTNLLNRYCTEKVVVENKTSE